MSRENVDRLVDLARKWGLLPFDEQAVARAKRTRVLMLFHKESETRVDVLLGLFPFEARAATQSDPLSFEGLELPICSKLDLIVLKAFAGRPKDFGDIETMLRMNPDLDRKKLAKELQKLSRLVEDPTIWHRVESLPAWRSG